MRVDPGLVGPAKIILSCPLRPWHAVVPVLDIRADQVEDSRERRDKQVADIVLGIDAEGSSIISSSEILDRELDPPICNHLLGHSGSVDEPPALGVGHDVRDPLSVLRLVSRVFQDPAISHSSARWRYTLVTAVCHH